MKDQELAEVGRVAYLQGAEITYLWPFDTLPETQRNSWLAAARAIRSQVESTAYERGMRDAAEIVADHVTSVSVFLKAEHAKVATKAKMEIVDAILSAIPNHKQGDTQ